MGAAFYAEPFARVGETLWIGRALGYSCENKRVNVASKGWGREQGVAASAKIAREMIFRDIDWGPARILNYIAEKRISSDVNWKCHLSWKFQELSRL